MPSGIQEGLLLARYTTLHVGGEARYGAEVTNEEELKAALQFSKKIAAPLCVIGGGSNVLVADEGFPGLVIINKITGRRIVEKTEETVTVAFGAGEVLDECVAWTVDQGWWGLENLSLIPGTVGATPIQNVGAYGVEVSSRITAVRAIHKETLEEKIFSNIACNFSYRDSFFKTKEGRQWVVLEVTFLFSLLPRPVVSYPDLAPLLETEEVSLTQIREHIIAVRQKKFPDWSVVGTAGSFFKNPIFSAEAHRALLEKYPAIPSYIQPDGRVKISLGYVLDKVCGRKGYREGNVGLFEAQALVLVAYEGATAHEIKNFAEKISHEVYEKIFVTVESEVQCI